MSINSGSNSEKQLTKSNMQPAGAEKYFGLFLYWFTWILLTGCMCLFSVKNFRLVYGIAFLALTGSLWAAVKWHFTLHFPSGFSGYLLSFLTAFIPRLIYCVLINPYMKQYDDFEIVLKEAASGRFTDQLFYYKTYAHKIYYPLILHALGLRTQLSILIFQCVLCGLVSAVIYHACRRLFSPGTAAAGVLLYSFWPAQIIYTVITTEEHPAALLAVLILYGLLWITRTLDMTSSGTVPRRLIAGTLLTGFACGCIAFCKDWGIIMITAFLISCLWLLVHIRDARRRLLLLLSLVLLLGTRWGTQKLLYAGTEQIIGTTSSSNVVVAEMFTTLDPDSSGSYSEEGDAEYERIVEKNNGDYDKANKEALSILWQRIQKGADRMPAHLLKKGAEAYADDSSMLYWALRLGYTKGSQDAPASPAIQFLWILSRWYYALILLAILIGCAGKTYRRKFLMMLTMLGSICVGLLVESQGRYKYSIEPCWAMLAAVCLSDLKNSAASFSARCRQRSVRTSQR